MVYTKIHNDQVIILNSKRVFKYDSLDIIDYYTDHFEILEGDVVVDIGAWPGEFSIYAGRKKADVIAIEIFEEHTKQLSKNLQLNNVNCEVLNKGIWHCQETLDVTHDFFEGGGGGIIGDQTGDKEEITVNTFDSLLEYLIDENPDRETIDFIKMDIEGAELNALIGMEETIDRFHPEFAIADYHTINGVETAYGIEGFFNRKGYTFYTKFPHQTTIAYYEED